jgi:hypothetical protein
MSLACPTALTSQLSIIHHRHTLHIMRHVSRAVVCSVNARTGLTRGHWLNCVDDGSAAVADGQAPEIEKYASKMSIGPMTATMTPARRRYPMLCVLHINVQRPTQV